MWRSPLPKPLTLPLNRTRGEEAATWICRAKNPPPGQGAETAPGNRMRRQRLPLMNWEERGETHVARLTIWINLP